MRIHIGADHAALDAKNALVDALRGDGHELIDHGPFDYDPEDDYPAYCLRAGEGVAADEGSLGVVLGGSGNGEQIAANKVKGIRAALAWNEDTARLARGHNDANVVSIGARQHPEHEVVRLVRVFLDTPFSGEERHVRRIDQVRRYEEAGELPPLTSSIG